MDLTTENKPEVNGSLGIIEVKDERASPDNVQAYLLAERIKSDLVIDKLRQIRSFLGIYVSDVLPEDLSVTLVDGEFGSGTIKGKIVELALPSDGSMVETLLPFVGTLLPGAKEDEKETKAREVASAILSSTVFHEGTHAVIDSKPGSKMSQDLGIDDPGGETSTMVDEGITYALQGIYAKETYLVPGVKPDDRLEVKIRKKLGERIRPKVKELMDNKEVMSKDFLKYVLDVLEQVRSEG